MTSYEVNPFLNENASKMQQNVNLQLHIHSNIWSQIRILCSYIFMVSFIILRLYFCLNIFRYCETPFTEAAL